MHLCRHFLFSFYKVLVNQGSKIALVHSYLGVPQAAGQVEILIFLMKIYNFSIYANNFCDAGQVPILRNFEAWDSSCQFKGGPNSVPFNVVFIRLQGKPISSSFKNV